MRYGTDVNMRCSTGHYLVFKMVERISLQNALVINEDMQKDRGRMYL
jgi:hypothetical protein